jgi:hypothetical protein
MSSAKDAFAQRDSSNEATYYTRYGYSQVTNQPIHDRILTSFQLLVRRVLWSLQGMMCSWCVQ